MEFPENPYVLGHLFLRVSIAFAFLYPPIMALYDPVAWAGYFPAFIETLPMDSLLVLHVFGLLEVIIALWILWGRNLRVPAVLAAVVLLAIVVVNLNDFGILFRDVSLALATLALVFLPEPGTRPV